MLRLSESRSSSASSASSAEESGHRPSGGLRFLVLVAAVLSFLSLISYAQVTSGTMFGTVTDASGAVVAGAKVTVHSDDIGINRVVTSSGAGEFVVTNLPPATYWVSVEAQGFKGLKKEGVVLSAGDHLNGGEFVLQVGAASNEVTVNADTAELDRKSVV